MLIGRENMSFLKPSALLLLIGLSGCSKRPQRTPETIVREINATFKIDVRLDEINDLRAIDLGENNTPRIYVRFRLPDQDYSRLEKMLRSQPETENAFAWKSGSIPVSISWWDIPESTNNRTYGIYESQDAERFGNLEIGAFPSSNGGLTVYIYGMWFKGNDENRKPCGNQGPPNTSFNFSSLVHEVGQA